MKLNKVKWPNVIGSRTVLIKKSLEQHKIGRAKSNLDLIVQVRTLMIQTKYLSTLDVPEYSQMEFEYRMIAELYENINLQILLQNGVFKNKLKKLINEQKSYIRKL